MGFAFDAPVTGPSGEAAIRQPRRGDQVMAASLRDGGATVWEPAAILFSDGVGPGGWPTAMSIEFDDRGRRLICLAEQLFPESDGRLASARRLHIGRRSSVPRAASVSSRPSVGHFGGALHNLPTATCQARARHVPATCQLRASYVPGTCLALIQKETRARASD